MAAKSAARKKKEEIPRKESPKKALDVDRGTYFVSWRRIDGVVWGTIRSGSSVQWVYIYL